jgi:membrane-bound lytic murein transglycosylase D
LREFTQLAASRLPRPAALGGLLVLVVHLVACGSVRQPAAELGDWSPVDADWARLEPAAVDSLPLSLPDWPATQTAESSPDQWDEIYQSALNAVAAGEFELARDILFTLQDVTTDSEPAIADTLQLERRRSLQRRTVLLGGLLAEQAAAAAAPQTVDSVLTIAYLGLDGFGFPDSLVPATGTRLPSLQADLLKVQHAKVDRWIDYFTGPGARHFQVWLDRKAEVKILIDGILTAEGLPSELISLAMIESGLSTRATSSAGAVGPWQFMPGTARRYGLRINWWEDQRRDWELSTRAACRYLKDLYAEFGDWALVLASYNAGEGRVRRQLHLNGHDNYWDYRLPRQTVEYVPKFIAAARIVADPVAHGFTVPEPSPLMWEDMTVDDATDLNLLASCAGVDEQELVRLNPALLRRATPPGAGGQIVRVPPGTATVAAAALRKVPADRRLTWRKHEVKRGETLSHIASRWGTSVAALQEANAMGRSTLIRPGTQLLIPMPRDLAAAVRKRAEQSGLYVPPAGYERVTYHVRPGDTLSTIARRLGVSIKHLQQVNGISNPSRLRAGQTLAAYRPPGHNS